MSKQIKSLFFLSIPFFILHGIEEYLTGFYKVDVIFFGHLSPEISQVSFAIFQLLFWTFLIMVGKGFFNSKWTHYFIIFVGFIYIFELHHLIHTLFIEKAYYPGTITSLSFPVFAVLFWKEWLKTKTQYYF